MVNNLLNLPLEVLHTILTNVDAHDIAQLSCCRTLHVLIKGNRLLFKQVYLKHFDDPRQAGSEDVFPWEEELHKLVNARKILESHNEDLKKAQIETVAHSVELLLRTCGKPSTDPHNIAFLSRHFADKTFNSTTLLSGSSLYRWAEADAWRRHATYVSCRESSPEQTAGADEIGGENREEVEIDIDESSDLNEIFSSYQHHLDVIDAPHAIREPPRSVPAPSASKEEIQYRQTSAKLHCLCGIPIQEVHRVSTSPQRYSLRSDTAPIHPYARSRVYDLRQHTEASLWGPFLGDGTQNVDWEKIEAIMLILHRNMKDFAESHDMLDPDAIPAWDEPFGGTSPYSYVSRKMSVPMEPSLPLEARDPYNITGTWMRVVCFLDYTELFDFNFARNFPSSIEPRPALDTEEALRLLTMRIVATKIERPGEEDGQDLPIVHFKGTASSIRPSWDPNANSKIRGVVRLTPENEVRWTSWSIYHGEERWRSEGIQVGGVQSARGVLGYWFDKDFDEHGPAGPTAFWKSHDGIIQQKCPEGVTLQPGLHGFHAPLY